MTGIDPAPAMVEIARQGAYADRVRWICGDATQLGTVGADLAIMSGHVAQFFLTDESWHTALTAVRDALRPSGWLAFETRDPEAREWERWTRGARLSADDPTAGRIDTWLELPGGPRRDRLVRDPLRLRGVGKAIVTANELRFRSLDELTRLARRRRAPSDARKRVNGD